jgi:phosphoribosylaminoimidazole-succinocarboxamide synthase/phosphoribosylcarboxyaminoimidazole (NCAIR) mutase
MIALEVVTRRENHGSALKRWPDLVKGSLNPSLEVEFFLKTSNRQWRGQSIPCDDPYARFTESGLALYDPAKMIYHQEPFLTLDRWPLCDRPDLIEEIKRVTIQTFLILERAWALQGKVLVDFKLEFGLDINGCLLLSDVIDNDSWRLLDTTGGNYLDKQVYREGGDLNEVTRKYRAVAEATDRFYLPESKIILWAASPSDKIGPFYEAVSKLDLYAGNMEDPSDTSGLIVQGVGSFHRKPTEIAVPGVQELAHRYPNSVLLAYCGCSNGAGPTSSAQVPVPTITIPAGWKEFPLDVWSSLHTASRTPVTTILDPGNAVFAAIKILGMNNPHLYAVAEMIRQS